MIKEYFPRFEDILENLYFPFLTFLKNKDYNFYKKYSPCKYLNNVFQSIFPE